MEDSPLPRQRLPFDLSLYWVLDPDQWHTAVVRLVEEVLQVGAVTMLQLRAPSMHKRVWV
jgi:hypothetical protein